MVDFAVPFSPRTSTPPMPGDTALSTSPSRSSSIPTTALNGNPLTCFASRALIVVLRWQAATFLCRLLGWLGQATARAGAGVAAGAPAADHDSSPSRSPSSSRYTARSASRVPSSGLAHRPRSAASSSRSAMPRSAHGLDLRRNALVCSIEHVRGGQLLVHPVVDHAGGRVVAEQVVHGRGHLERALVPVPGHRGEPPRVDHPGAEHPLGLLGQGAGAHQVRHGRVADVGGRGGPGQVPHHGHHAAVELEVVVGVGDVVLAGVGVLRRDRDPSRTPSPCRRAPRGRPGRGRRRTRPRPRRPRPGRRRCASSARRSAAAARPRKRRAWSRRSGWSPAAGPRAPRCRRPRAPAGSSTPAARPGRPRPRSRRRAARSHAGTRPGRTRRCARSRRSGAGPASASGSHLEPGDPPRRVVPHRPAPDQRQHLGDVVALGAHGRRCPTRSARPTRGYDPVSARCRATSDSASAAPTSQALRDGIAFGSTE